MPNATSVGRKPMQWTRMAHRRWRHAIWIRGDGPFAVLAHCRSLAVELHKTLEAAERAKAAIGRSACGGGCHKDHEIINISGA